MNKLIFTTAFLIFTTLLNAQTPTFKWAKSMGGFYGNATGSSVVTDVSGNIYTTGYFEGRIDFDPGVGIFNLTSAGLNDIFVTKKDASGNFVWAKKFGGISDDYGYSISVNGSGNICVGGKFSGTADFDPGFAVYNLTSAGLTDIFIMKLNGTGSLAWAHRFGSTNIDVANAIAIDASNNVYTVGNFGGTVDFDPGSGSFNLITTGNARNVFISKLNSIGNFVWAKKLETNDGFGKSIAIDPSGNVCTAGYFYTGGDFDPGVGIYNLTPAGLGDIFISKLDSSGNFMWAKALGGTQEDQGNSLTSDAAGNIYTVGSFSGTCDFDPGPAIYNLTSAGYKDIFISKIDASGNHVWAIRIGDSPGNESAKSVVSDVAGNIYLTGNFIGGAVDFDPGPGTVYLSTLSYISIFILKLNSSGNFVLAKAFGGTYTADANSIAVDISGNIITTGIFWETCDFDPGTGLYKLYALGGNFMFTSKLNGTGNFVWTNAAGAGASTNVKSMTIDQFGNIYTTGYFFGTVDFDPGTGVFNLSTGSTDIEGDVFITKCNSYGNFVWAKKFGGVGFDYANAVAVDASGNVYTAGTFIGTADFNPGPATFNLTAISNSSDLFVSKLDAAGNFLWATRMGSLSVEDVYSIALDASGNLFTAGRYFPGTVPYQFYLNKLDPSGNITWSKIYGGSGAESANAIAADAAGNIYITGDFLGNTDLDPGPGIFPLSSLGNADIFVSKLDGSGNFVWGKQMPGQGTCSGSALALDASGNVLITGTFDQTTDFDPGTGTFNLSSVASLDIFICKLDNSGNFIWSKQFTGNNYEFARSIAVDNSGNVYTTGIFYSTTDLDPGPGTFNLVTGGGDDIFISKLDSYGNFVWAQQLGGPQDEQVYAAIPDGAGNIFTCGTFNKTVDFNQGSGISNLTANGSPNLFIHKMSQCLSPLALITPAGPITFCAGDSVTLDANTGTGLTYQWIKNGVPISGANASSYVAFTAGNYAAIVSNSLPCSETSNTIAVTVPCISVGPNGQRTVQLNEIDSEYFHAFPNPTIGKISIVSPPGQLQIFNSFGQQVYASDLKSDKSSLDLSYFPNGIYILQLRTETLIYTQKIILNH